MRVKLSIWKSEGKWTNCSVNLTFGNLTFEHVQQLSDLGPQVTKTNSFSTEVESRILHGNNAVTPINRSNSATTPKNPGY